MDRADLDLLEFGLELSAKKKADELGVTFRVKAKNKEGWLNILVRIKAGHPNNNVFAEYIGHLILDKYSCDVRYTYPTKLKGV